MNIPDFIDRLQRIIIRMERALEKNKGHEYSKGYFEGEIDAYKYVIEMLQEKEDKK